MNAHNQFHENTVDLTTPNQPLASRRNGVPTMMSAPLPPEEDDHDGVTAPSGSRKKEKKPTRARISVDESELLLDQAERDFLGTAPKRPITAYNAYFTVARKKWLDSHPKCDEDPNQKKSNRFLQMSKDIIRDWKALSEDDKAPYMAKSKAARAQYQIDLKEYKQRCRQLRRKQAANAKSRDTTVADEPAVDASQKARTSTTEIPSSRPCPQHAASAPVVPSSSINAPVARPLSIPSKVVSAPTTQQIPLATSTVPPPLQASLLAQQQQQLLLSQAGLVGGLLAPPPPMATLNLLQQQYSLQQHQLALQAQLSQAGMLATVDPLTGLLTPSLLQNHALASHQPIVILPSPAPVPPTTLSTPNASLVDTNIQRLQAQQQPQLSNVSSSGASSAAFHHHLAQQLQPNGN